MRERKKRPRSKNTDVWLNPQVVTALQELEDWYGPGCGRVARFFLINFLVDERIGNRLVDWNRQNKYLQEKPEGQVLVRMPLRIFDNLLAAVNTKAKSLSLTRSGLVRRVLTMAVDVRMEWRFPGLRKTLGAYGLEAEQEPWEK